MLGENEIILTADGDGIECARAESDDPDDFTIGLKYPSSFLVERVHFHVVEEVAHEFGAFHAEWPKAVSFPPVTKCDALTVK